MTLMTARCLLLVIGLGALLPARVAAQPAAPALAREPLSIVEQARLAARPAGQSNPDPLWNGTVIGMTVGFAAGFLTLAAYNAKETASGPIWDAEAIGYYTGAGLIGAGIGAGMGALIDALNTRGPSAPSTSPVQISPLLGNERRGAVVSLRF
jgi:hypothetical protein